MPRIAIGRIVGLVIATAGIGLSIWSGCAAVRMNADFHRWVDARPLESAIDLSQPGEITVPFFQTCSVSHGETLYLECDLDDEVKEHPEILFKDLSGNIVIRDRDGHEIDSIEFSDETAQSWDGKITLAKFSPFHKGDYVATIRVDSGAAALAGKEQRIYAKYELCGLEQLPAQVAGVFAFGVGFIGLFAGACVLPDVLKSGIWRAVPGESA